MKTNPSHSRGHKLAAVFLALLAACPAGAVEPASEQVASPDHAVAACDQDELAAENRRLREQVAQQQADLAALRAKFAASQQAVAQLTAAQQTVEGANAAKDAQIKRQAEVIEKQIEVIAQLQAKVADLTQSLVAEKAERRRALDNYLRVREQSKALLQEIEELKADAGRFGKPGPAPPWPDPDEVPVIRGSVVKIEQTNDGTTFLQINVGSDDNVKPGMAFIVYRGDQFVGKVKIDTVDTTESVGKLTLGEGVKVGDKVRAGGLGKPDKPEEAEKADKPEQTDPPVRQGPDE
jgi:hypothetical protein